MKKILTKFSILVLFVALFCSVQNMMAQRNTIAGWTFPTSLTLTNAITADCGIGTLYTDGTNGSDLWTIQTGNTQPGINYTTGGTAPSEALCDETTATKGLSFVGNAMNGKSAVFVVSTTDLVNIQVSFNGRGSSTGFSTQTWSHSSDGVDFVDDTVMTGMNSGTSTSFAATKSFTLANSANNQNVLYIRVTFDGASSTGNNRLDNICVSGESDLPIAAQPAFSQIEGNVCNAFTLSMTCATEGASIYYTLDGTTPDSQVGTLYTEPIALSSTTTVQAIAYAEGLDASAVRTATYTFPTEVATISAFKADEENSYFKLTGDLNVSYRTGSYMFVEDATAATCISASGLTAYNNGSVISGGVCGVKSAYYGMIELTVPEFNNPTPATGTAIDPVEVTIAELNANFSNYECRLVSVSNATMAAGSFTNSVNSVLELTQGSDAVFVANQFRTIDGLTAPTTLCAVTGVAMPHDETHRICPRGTYDVVAMIPAITILTPGYNQVFEQGDAINADFTTVYFNYENGAMIHAELLMNGQNVSDTYIHDAAELATYEATDLSTLLTELGDAQLIASLVDAENTVLSTDTVNFSYTAAYVAIETSENDLNFTETGESHGFAVAGFRLTNDIAITVDDTNFVVAPTTLPANVYGDSVVVTFVGDASANAVLTLTSDTVVTTVALHAELPIDEVIYSTGFESFEGFETSTTYNNDAPAYFGNTGEQWSTIHGAVTATQSDLIFGQQVMQMRYYGNTASSNQHLGHIGYVTTNFELHNVTKVEFFAKNNGTLNLTASYSFDGGNTFEGDTTYALTPTAQKYVLFVSDSGQHYGNRIRFTVTLPEEVGTGTYKLMIDSVVVYGVTGLEPSVVDMPTISEPSNNYILPITVSLDCATEDAEIYYTTDGTTPDETSTLYTAPFTLGTTCTLKARAFKGGMDPSNVAFAEYIFPTEVATIADFKTAGAADNTVTYKITGSVTFVYRSGRRIFIEDATGGLLVYDNSTPMITRTYNEGDVINGGVIGTYTLYNGMKEMIPVADWNAAFGTATVTPMLATAADLASDFATYESRLVRINAVTFAEGGEFTPSEVTEATVNDATGAFAFRNQFMTLDTTMAAGAEADVVGLAAIDATDDETTYQLFPRTNADIIEIVPEDTTSINNFELMQVSVYPNPTAGVVNVCFAQTGAQTTVQVCDIYGRMLVNELVTSELMALDFSAYAAGVYVVRIISVDGRTAVAKVTKR